MAWHWDAVMEIARKDREQSWLSEKPEVRETFNPPRQARPERHTSLPDFMAPQAYFTLKEGFGLLEKASSPVLSAGSAGGLILLRPPPGLPDAVAHHTHPYEVERIKQAGCFRSLCDIHCLSRPGSDRF